MKHMVLVPAFNEAENLPQVLASIENILPQAHIIVVDDGSTDQTQEILAPNTNITVLRHAYNAGIGGAIKTGFQYFLNHDFDFIVRIDGDGQHPVSQAPALLECVTSNKADAVIGSRFLERKGFQSSRTRRGGIKLLHILTRLILKQNITDNTSGFKAYNRTAVASIIKDYPHDYPEPIEVYLLIKRGLRLFEVPVVMKDRQAGQSSISLLDTYYYLVKVILTIVVNYMIGGRP